MTTIIGPNMPEKYTVDTEKVLAVLINPKTRELVEVHRERSYSVKLYYPGVADSISGTAHWDQDEVFHFNGDEYYRSHSPSAQVEKGKGFGVVLYGGLALRAFSDSDAVGIASADGNGSGHSSRSTWADEFWKRCVSNGLAEEDTTDQSEERSYELEGSDYFQSGCDDVPDEDCEEVENVSGSVDFTYRASGGDDLEVQYMAADKVSDANLIVALPGMNTKLDFEPLPADILATLNLQNCYNVGLAEMLIQRALSEDFDLAYVDRLVSSLPKEVYIKTSVAKQLKFGFVANGKRREIEREVDKLWGSVYGGLADID